MLKNLKVNLINFFQLKVEVEPLDSNTLFAYYLYRYNDAIEKTPYAKNTEYTFNLKEPGQYLVRVYAKGRGGIKEAVSTSRIPFDGFKEKGITTSPMSIMIYGVSRLSAAVKFILEEKFDIRGFITEDQTKIGQDYFGLEIFDFAKVDFNNVKVIVVDSFGERQKENFDKQGIQYELFKYNYFPSNLVLEAMYNLSAYRLYTIARKCYLNGIINGANFIKGFINYKFNSYIPYTVEMGEGTTFGYGGIGMVINGKSKIGNNVKIAQNVTIASRGDIPIIGDNVWIGPGSKLLGGKIGSNVVIGANSVVTKEIPDNCVVAGVPAKIISTDIEKYKHYFNGHELV